ncbi:actin-binding FH2, partial [Rozella allomycis CSF55]
AIMISRIKFSFEEISNIIINMDYDKKLTNDQLHSLLNCVPTEEEIDLLNCFEGDASDLDVAERFIHAVKIIPNMSNKIKSILYIRKFNTEKQEIQVQIEAVRIVANEISNFDNFKKFLELVLAVGNYLNGSTLRGSAFGFKLNDLNKLKEVKTGNSQIPTLLHYLVQQNPDILELITEINCFEKCLKSKYI